MRLLYQQDARDIKEYAHTIGSLQEVAESLRDMVMRTSLHVDNQHKGMLDVQIQELKEVKEKINSILSETSRGLAKGGKINFKNLEAMNSDLKKHISFLDDDQISQIMDDSSKTRLSIMYYGLLGNIQKIADNTQKVTEIFKQTFNVKK